MVATAELTSKLNQALAMRHIEEGFQILDEASRSFPEFDSHDAASAQFVLCIAEWVDAGYSDQRLIEMLLQKFPSERRRSMSIAEYLLLRMAEAFACIAKEDSGLWTTLRPRSNPPTTGSPSAISNPPADGSCAAPASTRGRCIILTKQW